MDKRRWEEIQATFDMLVELDVGERGSRLTALSDPELRTAVKSLLAADSEADARLAVLEGALLPQSRPAADPLGLAGRTVSHFQVREPIGAGGMGVVYRAEDTRLGRPVALKFLLPPYNLDAAAKARFLHEAHSAAALDHANLCTIHEVGASEDGRLFLAMALYPGETLKARLARDGAMSVGEILGIARQVGEGLEAAHAAGIVHRDLKPGNVMLVPDGSVKILDFGLAKARDQSLSETGSRLGTVSYMAPEQIRGERVDERADLWALGVVLYEMLAGRRPFGGEHDIAVAHAILHDDPLLPSTQRADVSAAVDDVVLRLLQKDPAKRYPSARVLLGDLATIGMGAGRAVARLRRRWRHARRMLPAKARWVAAVGAGLVAGGAVGYTAITPKRGSGPAVAARTAIAVLPFRNLSVAGPDAYFAAGLHDEILSQLYKVPAIKVIGRNSVMGYAGPNTPPLRQIASELGVGTVVEGSVQVVGNRVRVNVQLMDAATDAPLWAERYDRSLDDAFAIQSDIAQQIVGTVGAALSSAERRGMTEVPTSKADAYLLFLRGREYGGRPGLLRDNLQGAQQLYERALALDPDFALARAALSRVHGSMYWLRYDMSPARLARQREEAEAALRLAPNLPQARVSMGHVYAVGPADSRAALREYRLAARGLPNDPDVWRWIAQAHRRLGQWEKFSEPFERAVYLDPRNADLLWDQGGGTYSRMGRHAEAIRWFDRALRIAPNLHSAALAKGWVYLGWQGQLDTLRAVLRVLSQNTELMAGETGTANHARVFYFERQADSLLRVLANAHVPVLQSVITYAPISLWAAWAHELRGDPVAARAAFDSALAVLDSAILKFPDDWPVHQARGMALAGLGRRDEALREVRWLQECLIYRKDAYQRSNVAAGAAKILARAGETDASLNMVTQLLAQRPPGMSIHFLRLDPIWDPLRNHPRFRTLLAKYGN